jgi:transcriptional regulator with XRE-family HTH domain
MNLSAREKLAKLVKETRGDLSQRAFGKKIGVTGTAVRLWEEMETFPDTANLERIGELAGYSLEELMRFLDGSSRLQIDTSEFVFYLKLMRRMDREQLVKVVQAGAELLGSAG